MYPVTPISVLDSVTPDSLVRTGFPVASLLALATVLILLGLFAFRSASVLGSRSDARQ